MIREKKRIYSLSVDKIIAMKHINSFLNDHFGFVAFATAEINVPKELFAEKPKTGFKKAMWNWVNFLHEGDPIDECRYRERALAAFTIKPVALIFLSAAILFIGAFYIAYAMVGSLLCLFFGFRPEPIQTIKDFVKEKGAHIRCNLLKYRRKDKRYRLWSISYDASGGEKRIYLPVSGIEVALFGLGIYGCCFQLGVGLEIVGYALIAILIAVIWLARLANYIKSHLKPKSKRQKAKAEEYILREKESVRQLKLEQEHYQQWLRELSATSTAYTNKERFIQQFYVGYETLKAKVCKPFAR